MDLNAFGAILLLSVCGLRFVDGASWSHNANHNDGRYDGQKFCQLEGGSKYIPFIYSPSSPAPGTTLWTFQSPDDPAIVNMATRTSSSNIYQGYTGRLTLASGSGQAGFTLSSLKKTDKGRYTCQAIFQSSALNDYINLQVIVKPTITKSSANSNGISLDEGQSYTLLCTATGNPTPKITWKKDGQIQTRPSTSGTNYEVKTAKRSSRGTYTCEARVNDCDNTFDFTESYSVVVKVTFKPVVTSITGNLSISENSLVRLSCLADGEPPVSEYFWYRGQQTSTQISTNSKYELHVQDNKKILLIKNLQQNDGGFYTCAARNSRGLGLGRSTYIQVQYAPRTVNIKFNPSNVVDSFASVTMTCESDGYPTPTYSWKFNYTQSIGSNEKTLIQGGVNKESAGRYSCIATNSFGVKEGYAFLHVRYAPIKTMLSTGHPIRNAAILGQRVTITCRADGYPPPTYVIKKRVSGSDTTVHGPGGNGQYVFDNVRFEDQLVTWLCVATNSKGSGITATMTIRVIVAPTFLTSLPTGEPIKTENQTQNYTCTTQGKPLPLVRWKVRDENVTEFTPELGRIVAKASPIPNSQLVKMESTLYIQRLTWKHYGEITCIATNDAGQRELTTRLQVRHCPVVKTEADHPHNVTVDDGESGTFRCRTIGNPPTLYTEWYFNGVKIENSKTESTVATYTRSNVGKQDAGIYACRGYSTLCPFGGPLFGTDLFIKTAPKIDYWPRVTIANETESARLYCQVSGIPIPQVTWTKEGNSTILHRGKDFIIGNLTYEDRGKYTCTATNTEAVAYVTMKLLVQVVPLITTDKPTDTQIAGVIGELSPRIRCKARAEPKAEYWWTRGSSSTHLKGGADGVDSIIDEGDAWAIRVQVTTIGETFYCHAKNMMGKDKQQYTIREKGRPDAPIDIKVVGFQIPNSRLIDVNITWVPGYDGGYAQTFTVQYKLASGSEFTRIATNSINHLQLKELKPLVVYNFMVTSSNQVGKSPNSQVLRYYTPVSHLPPARGTFTVLRNPDDGTQFFISWTVGENVTASYLQYREQQPAKARKRRAAEPDKATFSRWMDVQGAQGLSRNDTEFTVINLDASKTYQFRIIFLHPGERLDSITEAMWVQSDLVVPVVAPTTGKRSLSTDELIAIIGGCGGVLLILVVILCLCCFKKRKKPYGADSVEMSPNGIGPNPYNSYASGGPDISRISNGRRSLDVEDDPFIEAHLATMAEVDGKRKKKPDSSLNYGYASQGLRGISQSMGQLETSRGGYPASGPQRDVGGTLPAYHEPPSFEEALRQSGRKSKNKNKSTGDLDNLRRTPIEDMSDSSDSERYYRKKPPSRDSDEDPGYASVDLLNGGHRPILGHPRHASNGPLDPSVPYARPSKAKPHHRMPPPREPDEPTRGPPPQYTAIHDREPIPGIEDDYEPRVSRRRALRNDVMELDNSPDYRGNDRLPDLPPRMPELHNSRGLVHKQPLGDDDFPEPPSFLREMAYSDDDREPYPPYSRSNTENRTPTSRSGRQQQQPYRNIHGQLVRPNSQGSDLNRNDPPIRYSSGALEPEPEPRRSRSGGGSDDRSRSGRGSEDRSRSGGGSDDRSREGPYVSSGFLV